MEDFISQMQLHARGIWKYRWLAIGSMWVVAVLGWVVVLRLPNDYQSSARVFVDTQSILKPLMASMTSMPNVQQQVSIMSRTLLSRPNLERVLRMVDLDVDATTPRQRERQIDDLAMRLKISGTSTNDIYSITYGGDNPKQVHDVVQALLTIFLEGSFKGKKADSQNAIRFIDEQIKSYEQRLVAAENTVKEFKLRNSELLPRQGVDYAAQLAIASDALSTARIDLLEAEQARLAIQARINGDPVPAAAGAGTEQRARNIVNPDIDARIAAINKNLDTLRLQYTDLHPDVVAARRLLAQLDARKIEESKQAQRDGDPGRYYSPMLQQLKVALTEADAKVAAMRVRVHEYSVRHERLREQSNAVPEVESQLAQLNRDYDINKDNYEKLIARRETARITGDLSSSTEMMTFRIIDPPSMPLSPSGPNRRLFHSGVLLIAVCAGLGVALMISQVRPTFVSPSALREITGLNVLGTVSMSWNDAERNKLRRGQYLLGGAFAALLGLYGAIMASGFLMG